MKKFLISLIIFVMCFVINIQTLAYGNALENNNIIYNKTLAIAAPAEPKKDKPLMYPNPRNGYRTGFARPKTRFAHINKRFSKPQTRYAHKRPDYIYSKEYQNNIVNRHNPGMVSKNNKPAITIPQPTINTNKNKIIACSGITYYGIQNSCK